MYFQFWTRTKANCLYPVASGKAKEIRICWTDFERRDSDHDFSSDCRNDSQCHHKQSFSGLHSPGWSIIILPTYDMTLGFKPFTDLERCFFKSRGQESGRLHFENICTFIKITEINKDTRLRPLVNVLLAVGNRLFYIVSHPSTWRGSNNLRNFQKRFSKWRFLK